jgi:hypothetical protein
VLPPNNLIEVLHSCEMTFLAHINFSWMNFINYSGSLFIPVFIMIGKKIQWKDFQYRKMEMRIYVKMKRDQ